MGKHVEAIDLLLKGSKVQKELTALKKLVERYRFKEALKAVGKLAEALNHITQGE